MTLQPQHSYKILGFSGKSARHTVRNYCLWACCPALFSGDPQRTAGRSDPNRNLARQPDAQKKDLALLMLDDVQA